MRLWKFLICHFDQHFWLIFLIYFGIFIFWFLNFLKFRFNFCSANFRSFLPRIRPRECHNWIPREKLYRIHKFSAKLVPWKPILCSIYVFCLFFDVLAQNWAPGVSYSDSSQKITQGTPILVQIGAMKARFMSISFLMCSPSRLWEFLTNIRNLFKDFSQFRLSFLIARFPYCKVKGVQLYIIFTFS